MYGDRGINNLGIGNKFMMEKNLIENTYEKWAGYGTLYGFTRDSFVSLSQSLETLLKNAPDIRVHMKTIYYHMAVICLAQRASVLRFGAEVSSLADLGKKRTTEQDKKLTKNIQKLYLNYIEFINKIYFREITPQIQGIEIYSQFQKIMNIHADVKDLDSEIGELHEYVNLIQNERRNEEASRLNWLATKFLPITLVFSILGANIFPGDKSHFWTSNSIWGLIAGLAASIVISFLFNQYLKRRKSDE